MVRTEVSRSRVAALALAFVAAGAGFYWARPSTSAGGDPKSSIASRGSAKSKSKAESAVVPSRPDAVVNVAPDARVAGAEPLDCTKREQKLVAVGDSTILSGSVCDELRVTSGLGPTIDGGALARFGRPLLEQLIDATLVRDALANRGKRVTDTVVRAAFAAKGASGAELGELERAVLERQVRAREERRHFVELAGALTVSELAVEAEYGSHPQLWATARGATAVDGYLHRVPGDAPAPEVEKARALAEALSLRLKAAALGPHLPAEAGFQTLARFDVSASGAAADVHAGVSGLAEGAVTGAIRTRAGWLVARVLEVAKSRPRTLGEASPEIRRTLEAAKREAEEKRLLAELRSATRVEYFVRW